MNAQLDQLLSRYHQLSARDQLALKGLSIFFLVLFLYAGMWLPANNYFEDRESFHQKQSELHSYLRSTEEQARASSGQTGTTASGQPILQSVSRSAQKFSLKPDRLQPEGSGGVNIMFNNVSFNSLVQWLESLNREGFSVKQISIERGEAPGVVSVRMVLRA